MVSDQREWLILVADDSADDRMFIRNALHAVAPKVRVSETVDGIDTLAYLRGAAQPFPDLLLLDLKMPRMDGLETLAEIRGDPGLRHLPVIAIFTTATDPEFVRRAYASGVNAYVGKPSTLGELKVLMEVLVRHWFEIATLPSHAQLTAARPNSH